MSASPQVRVTKYPQAAFPCFSFSASASGIAKHCQRHHGPDGCVVLKFKSWSIFIFRISTKRQLQNLNQTSPSRLNLNSKYWLNLASASRSRFNFVTSAKHQRQNSDQTPAWKSCLNLNFKPCAQSLNKCLALWPNLNSQISNKLLPTRSSSSTLATVTTSTSFELASSHARVKSIKFTKQESVS